mgnify:CR=1 FL=1
MDVQEQGLRDAVLSDPDSDDPRLIYADWLEERGDVRGEFIRLQCQLSHEQDGDQRWELQCRQEAMLEKYLLKWIKQLPKFGANAWGISPWHLGRRDGFVRGMMERATFGNHAQFAKFFDEMWKVTPVRHVRFNNWSKKGIHYCFENPSVYERLRGLWLTWDSFDVELTQAVELFRMPNLDRLDTVRMADNAMNPAAMEAMLAAPLESIRRLDLHYTAREGELVTQLAKWERLDQLEDLRLSNNGCGASAAIALADADVNNLRRLDINGNDVHDGLANFATRLQAPNLKELDISYNGLTSAGVQALARSSLLSRLFSLDLSSNPELDIDGIWNLVDTPNCSELRRLKLSGCGLQDDALNALAESKHLANLRELDLSTNQFTGEGLRKFAGSSGLPNLEYLVIDHEQLSDDTHTIRGPLSGDTHALLLDRFGNCKAGKDKGDNTVYASKEAYLS